MTCSRPSPDWLEQFRLAIEEEDEVFQQQLLAEDEMMIDDFNDSKVTVKKTVLLEKIKSNRNGHRAEFEEAQRNYREAIVRELDLMLKDAREGRKIRRTVALVEPEDHTKDYDRVIAMLEMSTADVIVITERQFAQYALDEWGWMESFKNSTSGYTPDRR